MLVERRDAGTQPPFFDFELFFLTDRRDFCQDATEENDQTARNETRWYHLRPAGAGFLRKYFASRRRGRATSGKAKNNERELNYEKSKYDIDSDPVGAGLFCVFVRSESSGSGGAGLSRRQYCRWAERPLKSYHRP